MTWKTTITTEVALAWDEHNTLTKDKYNRISNTDGAEDIKNNNNDNNNNASHKDDHT